MHRIPQDYMERVYAGWLGKIIGIRHGAPIEGWTYEKIRTIIGEIDSYLVNYREFAADDDSNGPLFFLRGLETAKDPRNPEPQDIANALLNYAPYERGFFWWGGYGISTEHTAYLNLRSGVPAPRSGSIDQNGAAVAEQIGGQIFIDTWGLVAPGNPELAARLAKAAASVMHGGNGVYGGIFVAVCISLAFTEKDIPSIIRRALEFIPGDCEYARAVNAVLDFHAAHADEGWRACFDYIYANFGYDRYPGHCHIIPNAAVMILSMLYGSGDFIRTINICNMCGWDTDCNVGNVATILGVYTKLANVDYEKWIRPVHDLLICSGVVGSLNIMDIPYGASYIAKWAYRLAEESMTEPWCTILGNCIDGCHFEYPGSTHSVAVRGENPGKPLEAYLFNTDEQAHSGKRSLRIAVPGLRPAESVFIHKRTYYRPADFHDSRYDPSFSPTLYPGQRIRASVRLSEMSCPAQACLYVHDANNDRTYTSEAVNCAFGQWIDLSFGIPAMEGALIDEAGVCMRMLGEHGSGSAGLVMHLDDLLFDGEPDYGLELSRERVEFWNPSHTEISQFTRLKGLLYMENGSMHMSCADFAEAYTGRHDWQDYEAEFRINVLTGENARVNFRVQGAMRSYAAGFDGSGRFTLFKNDCGYRPLCSGNFDWISGEAYTITVSSVGNKLTARCGDLVLSYTDTDSPLMEGCVGISAEKGVHMSLSSIRVKGIPTHI
ncbi:MAG: ADP-ribosylglycohydrolase family protein [Clostridia bacterium]|nr:ADP-ribosylglycohydrolase family protein [Clostridia bacterium]